MSNQIVEANPFGGNPREILATPDQAPLVWSEFAKSIGLRGTPIGAQDLIGKTFDIMRAKAFESSFPGQGHAWYCVIKPVDQDELFSVVLGGGAVVEILDAFAKSGMTQPLRVALGWKDGGKFSGYYTLE
jgi:hypothetical protein